MSRPPVNPLPPVLGDDREDPLRAAVLESEGIDAVYYKGLRFDYADWCWHSLRHGCSVGMQLKTVSETLDRFKKGQLGEILRGLHQEFDIPIFLMGGYLGETSEGWCDIRQTVVHIRYQGVLNYLEYSLPRDLPGLLVSRIGMSTHQALMKRVASTVKYWETEATGVTWMPVSQRALFSIDTEEQKALESLMCYPGVGEDVAKNILKEYSPGAFLAAVMAGADKELIKRVSLLGKKRVENIREVLNYGTLPSISP